MAISFAATIGGQELRVGRLPWENAVRVAISYPDGEVYAIPLSADDARQIGQALIDAASDLGAIARGER